MPSAWARRIWAASRGLSMPASAKRRVVHSSSRSGVQTSLTPRLYHADPRGRYRPPGQLAPLRAARPPSSANSGGGTDPESSPPDQEDAMKEPFRADMEMIRRRAREKMDQGAVTSAYRADREQVISVLNEVLATEIVCTLR